MQARVTLSHARRPSGGILLVRVVQVLAPAAFLAFFTPSASAQTTLITFDNIPSGLIGNQYLNVGVLFLRGNGEKGASTGPRVDGSNNPITASVGSFGTAISQPNVMVAAPGSNDDIIVRFFDEHGNRHTVSKVGITNDSQGQPDRVVIEGFSSAGVSLGSTTLIGPGGSAVFSSLGIYEAKIYAAPGTSDLLGVDNFITVANPAPEPGTLLLLLPGMVGVGILRRKRNQ